MIVSRSLQAFLCPQSRLPWPRLRALKALRLATHLWAWRPRCIRGLCYVSLLALCALSHSAFAAKKVLFVSPSHSDDPFFSQVDAMARIAARSLGLELHIIHSGGNRLLQLQLMTEHLQQQQPDYAIVQVYSGGGVAMMELLKNYPIHVITLEQLFLPHERQQIGYPGEKYPYWLAEVYHDNVAASAKLSQRLLELCPREFHKGGVIGLNGAHGLEAEQRALGLQHALHQYQVPLRQIVHANWQQDTASTQALRLRQRYPDSRIIWAASDWMALGAISALPHDEKYCVAGFDWIPAAVSKIKQQQLTVSVGGHFMMAAWALVMIYDHQHQSLPTNQRGGQATFALEVLDASNVATMEPYLTPQHWQHVDFKKFSFHTNPTQGSYPFSLSAAMAIQQTQAERPQKTAQPKRNTSS